MREYTAKRRIVRAAKQRAFQHFRCEAALKRSPAAAVHKAHTLPAAVQPRWRILFMSFNSSSCHKFLGVVDCGQ